ncbi:MAG: hypothetical protein AAFU38_10120 [Bacteroidota bacterium]
MASGLAVRQDNTVRALSELAGLADVRQINRLTVANDSEAAFWLHARDGYEVVGDVLVLDAVAGALGTLANSPADLTQDALDDALETGLDAAIDEHQRRTSRLRPPAVRGGAPRPAHPAPLNYADRTTDTASSYRTRANTRPEVRHPYDGAPNV